MPKESGARGRLPPIKRGREIQVPVSFTDEFIVVRDLYLLVMHLVIDVFASSNMFCCFVENFVMLC